MSKDISFSRFVYPDTNILRMLVTNPKFARPFQDYLYRNDLCIAVSSGQVAELSEVKNIHADINFLLTAIPSVVIKPPDMILDEEIKAYPHNWTLDNDNSLA
jgi:hypothetical protein